MSHGVSAPFEGVDTTERSSSVDRPVVCLALPLLATFAVATTQVMPVLVGMLVGDLRFSPADAGRISSAFSFAGIAGGVCGFFWVARANRRLALLAAIILGFVADLSAVWLHSLEAMIAGRLMAGLASSTIMVVVNATIAASRRSERLFGVSVAGQSLLASAAFFALPRLPVGISGLFCLLASLWLVSGCLSSFIPRTVEHLVRRKEAECSDDTRLSRRSVTALVVAFASLYIGTGAFWTYAELIGAWHHLSHKAIGTAMSLSMACAVVGALSVAAIGKRFGRVAPLTLGLFVNAASAGILLAPIGMRGYTLAVCGLNLCSNLNLALFLALFGSLDATGRLLAVASAVVWAGYSLGPLLLGPSIAHGNYSTLVLCVVLLLAISPLVLVYGVKALAGEKAAKS